MITTHLGLLFKINIHCTPQKRFCTTLSLFLFFSEILQIVKKISFLYTFQALSKSVYEYKEVHRFVELLLNVFDVYHFLNWYESGVSVSQLYKHYRRFCVKWSVSTGVLSISFVMGCSFFMLFFCFSPFFLSFFLFFFFFLKRGRRGALCFFLCGCYCCFYCHHFTLL